jgi:hypothetical protein
MQDIKIKKPLIECKLDKKNVAKNRIYKFVFYVALLHLALTTFSWFLKISLPDIGVEYKAVKVDPVISDLAIAEAENKATLAEDKILDCLLDLESKGDHNKIILDTNNKYSIGGYQFQILTIKDILKRHENRLIGTEEAIRLAKSPIEARELARRAIFDYQLGSKWSLSFKKMKNGGCGQLTPEEIALINKNL